jgi:hypothetical protein
VQEKLGDRVRTSWRVESITKNADGTWNLPENEALPFSNPDYIYGNSVDISGDDITYGADGKKSLSVNGTLIPENQVYYSADGTKGTTGGDGNVPLLRGGEKVPLPPGGGEGTVTVNGAIVAVPTIALPTLPLKVPVTV